MFSFFGCESSDNKLKIAMVSDIGSIDDKSFNQSAWEGILKYANEKKLPRANYSHKNSSKPEDYIINLSNFADSHPALIVSPGYYFKEPIDIVASKYPKQNFLLIDAISKRKNVLSVTFATNEGSFLAGICAALKANELKSDKIGFLGGIKGKIVEDFRVGFEQGVKTINPDINIVVKYANDFANPNKGQRIASKMYDDGIKIIFNVAGSTGNGLIKEAKKRAKLNQDVWVIGVDKDQYEDGIYKNDKSVVLTSALKKLDVVTYDTIKEVENNKFQGGHKVYTLKNGGVGLPVNNPNIKDEWKKLIAQYKQKILNGEIKVKASPLTK